MLNVANNHFMLSAVAPLGDLMLISKLEVTALVGLLSQY
jgi:hypothetical protein